MMGVMDEMLRNGTLTSQTLNRAAGFLIHPLDVPGVAVLISAGQRVASTWRPRHSAPLSESLSALSATPC